MKKVTGNMVQAFRTEHECSMFDAKRMVYRQVAHEAVDDAQTVEELKEVLHLIINGEL